MTGLEMSVVFALLTFVELDGAVIFLFLVDEGTAGSAADPLE